MNKSTFFRPEKFDVNDYRLPNLVSDAGAEIDHYLIDNKEGFEMLKKSTPKLSKLIYENATELNKMSGPKIPASFDYPTSKWLINALGIYKNSNNKSPYIIDTKFIDVLNGKPSEKTKGLTIDDLRDALVPVMYHISGDLKSYKAFSKERQETLRDFLLTLSHESRRYARPFGSQSLAA